MKSILWALALTVATLFAHSATARSENPPVLPGRVVKVIDGDTIDVQLQSGLIRVRLHGVDAPEKAQDHGKESTAALALLVMDKEVQVAPFEQDRFDRLVGIVFLGELNVNSALVRNGHAWAMRRYMRKADSNLCRLEDEARLNRRGLWASSDAMAPWAYRRRKERSNPTQRSLETAESCIAAIRKPYS